MRNYVGLKFMQDWFHPPFWWLFNASAKQHDLNYTIGGTREDRLKADLGFFWRTLEDANLIQGIWKKRKAIYTAIIYFIFVRSFGWISFKFR